MRSLLRTRTSGGTPKFWALPSLLLGLALALSSKPAQAETRSCSSQSGRRASLASRPDANSGQLRWLTAGRREAATPFRGSAFIGVRNATALAEAGCAPGSLRDVALAEIALELEQSLGVSAELMIVLSTGQLSCSDLYYLPLANDIEGLGYVHTHGQSQFDESPNSALLGVAFLNDWPYWREHPGEFASAFNHELGHRWGARVHAMIDGKNSAALLGRQNQHWSYFLDTESSPLEGNDWESGEAAVFRTATRRHSSLFSPLDLYLMGALPAEAVPPMRLLYDVKADVDDCRERPLNPTSPPQYCGPLSVTARERTVTVEDVIAAEGPRVPAYRDEVERLRTLVVVLETERQPLTRELCTELEQVIPDRFDEFGRATGDRIELVNAAPGSEVCASLEDAPSADHTGEVAAPASAGCALTPQGSMQTTRGQWAWMAAVTLLYGLALRRRSRVAQN